MTRIGTRAQTRTAAAIAATTAAAAATSATATATTFAVAAAEASTSTSRRPPPPPQPTSTTTTTTITERRHERERKRKKRKCCSYCKKPGHDWRTCEKFKMSVVPSLLNNSEWAIFPRRSASLLSFDEKKIVLRALHWCLIERQAGFTVSTLKPFARAQKYIGVSETKLRGLDAYWKRTKQIEPTDTRRGKYTRQKHWSRHWITEIRVTVNALNQQGRPVTVRAIQAALDLEQRCGLKMSDRTLCRILLEIGFSYDDANKATRTFIETPAIKRWRLQYLQDRNRIRTQEPGTIEIWMDESYCNQNHVARKSWYRKGDTVKRRQGKGKRWIIVHAGGSCGWVGDPMVFDPAASGGSSNNNNGGNDNDDYHSNMNSEIFQKYFEKLCRWMKDRYGKQRKVVFHMDNASYHKKIDGLEKPLSKLNKTELVNWLKSQNVSDAEVYNNNDNSGNGPRKLKKKKELYDIARVRSKGKTITEITAAGYGYEVLWIPPYHPMLNPIEEAWGVTKGFVASENNGSSFDAVHGLIFEGFKKVTNEVWMKLVNRTHAFEDKMVVDNNIASTLTTNDIDDMIADVDSDEKEDEIEKIVDSRIENERMEYLVKWKGYSDSYNTWEPESNLANARAAIDDFERERRRQQRLGLPIKKSVFDCVDIDMDDGEDDEDGEDGRDDQDGEGDGGDGGNGSTTESEDWLQLYRVEEKGKSRAVDDGDEEEDADNCGLDCVEFDDVFEDSITQELLE
jgi:Chromo (CHRromatin Organisation MOdifier) domain